MAGVRGLTGWLGVVLDSPDPRALAGFYQLLLGWEVSSSSPTWVDMLIPDSEGRGMSSNLSFQLEPEYEPPVWRGRAGRQQMQFHLDLGVVDVGAAVEDALALGARLATTSPRTTCGSCSTRADTPSASTRTRHRGVESKVESLR